MLNLWSWPATSGKGQAGAGAVTGIGELRSNVLTPSCCYDVKPQVRKDTLKTRLRYISLVLVLLQSHREVCLFCFLFFVFCFLFFVFCFSFRVQLEQC